MKRLHLLLSSSLLMGLGASVFVACADSETPPPSAAPGETISLPDAGAVVDADTDATDGGCADAASSEGCVVTTDCTAVDFCTAAFPVSRQVSLNAIWGSAADDVWAVGTRGTILHGDGTSFTPAAPSSTDVYFAVWGSGKGDVWAVNATTPLHSTGFQDGKATFVPQTGSVWTPGSTRIWTGVSTSPTTVWIGGDNSTKFGTPSSSFWRLGADGDGGVAWAGLPACPPNTYFCAAAPRGLWAADAQDVWAVGTGGQAYHMDNVAGQWVQLDTKSNSNLSSIWGSGPSDVWAVGEGGTILHTTGASQAWTTVPTPTRSGLNAIWGSGPNDIWAVGNSGTVLHYDGVAWTLGTIGLEPGDPATNLYGVWGSGPDDVWIVGESLILHRTKTSRRHS